MRRSLFLKREKGRGRERRQDLITDKLVTFAKQVFLLAGRKTGQLIAFFL
jgi:hypothetical protein